MKQLKDIINEKLIIHKDSKTKKPIERASVDDIIKYLNSITDNYNIKWGIDVFVENHWKKDQLNKHKDEISDIIPANYFISQLLEIGKTPIKNIYDQIFKNNKGVIDIHLTHIKSTNDEYFCLVYDNRLDPNFKIIK